ncbi:MAG TPA: hypothetical protein VK907_06850 [Phnomibacter sp.]|nr:hypothetical protein [Phnomibacter sp.]
MRTKQFAKIVLLATITGVSILPAAYSAPGKDKAADKKIDLSENPRAMYLMERLENIKEMDRSALTRNEKKDMRKEVIEIKKEMKALSGGVYISVAAIIIIILLLILLL